MPPAQTRSRSGCIACKAKRKKCDETRPSCQRCERAGVKCPGYATVDSKQEPEGEYTKYWTKSVYSIPLKERAALAKAPRYFASGSSNGNSETRLWSSLDHGVESSSTSPEQERGVAAHKVDSIAGLATFNLFDLPTLGLDTPSQFIPNIERWNLDMALLSTSHASLDGLHSALPNPSVDQIFPLYMSTSDGQSSSDFQPSNLALGSHQPLESNSLRAPGTVSHLSENSLTHPVSLPKLSNRAVIPISLSPSPHLKTLPMIENNEENLENVKRIILGSLSLDRTVQSNSLPFVLQSYAGWIERVAFNPLKVAQRARGVIFRHFYGTEESRWTITLFANLFRKLSASTLVSDVWGPSYRSMISALLGRVHQNLSMAGLSYGTAHKAETQELIKALDNTLELVSICYIASRMDWGMELMQKAAPLFRRACPDPPGRPIHLQSLLLQPIECLRHYAVLDILKSVTMDRPMFCQYDTTIYPELGSTMSNFAEDAGLQWSHGIPDPIILVFARINTLRYRSIWGAGAVGELEAVIRDFVPVSSVSPEPFLTIARIVVQECWRQVAYIYLYLVLGGDNASSPQVVQALSRFTNLLDSVKPGRVPDSFIMLNLIIAGVVTRQPEDRQSIRQRIIGVENFRYQGASALSRLELVWKKTDELGRPAVWADLKDSYAQLGSS